MKVYNVLIDQQPFFDIPIKNKEQTNEQIIELINNSRHNSGNFLDYDYFSKHYKLIAIDLSKENVDLKNQQINFIGKLEQASTLFFIVEKEQETILEFKQNYLIVYE